MSITTGIMRPSDLGLEGEAVSFIRGWTWRDVERAMYAACAGQGVEVLVVDTVPNHHVHGSDCVLRIQGDEDAVRWVGIESARYVCAALGLPESALTQHSFHQDDVSTVRFTIPDHTIEPITYLGHVPGRQCAEGVECPLCVRLELGFVPPHSVSYAMALFEGQPIGELYDCVYRVGRALVTTYLMTSARFSATIRHVPSTTYIRKYETTVTLEGDALGDGGMLHEEHCWTISEARKQHARWLVKVAEGEVG